jgi:hypothetical protein
MPNAFTSEECNVLAEALDVAWDICRHSGELDAMKLDSTKATLTRAILTGYDNGERNVRRLAIAAVAQLNAPQAPFAPERRQTPAA